MTIRFGDIIEQLRMRVIKDIEYILDNSQTSVQSDKAILCVKITINCIKILLV